MNLVNFSSEERDDWVVYSVTISGADVSVGIGDSKALLAYSSGIEVKQGDNIDVRLAVKYSFEEVEGAVRRLVMERFAPFIVSEQDVEPAIEPICFSDERPVPGKNFSFTIEVLRKPKYTLSSYDAPSVELEKPRVTEQNIQFAIDDLMRNYSTYEAFDAGRPVQMGDYVKIDLATTKDSKEVAGLTGDGRLLEINYDFMPKGFIDAVLGMEVGERKTFDFEAPADFSEFKDSMDSFTTTVTVKEIQRPVLPALTDKWVRETVGAASVDDLKKNIEKMLKERYAENFAAQKSTVLVDELAGRLQGAIPDEIYVATRDNLINDTRQRLSQLGKTLEDMLEEQKVSKDDFAMQTMMDARVILRRGFALDALYDHLYPNGELLESDYEEAYKTLGPGEEEKVKQNFKATGKMYAIKELAKRNKAQRWLMKHATIKEL
jgi:trigger factor